MDKKNILWVCSIAWMREDNSYFPSAEIPSVVSSSAFQQAIIEGMEDQGYNIRILSGISGMLQRTEWSHNGKSLDIVIKECKSRLWRIPQKIIRLLKELKNSETLKETDYLIAYEMHFPYLVFLHRAKRINPKIKTVLICPDLNIHMDLDIGKKPIKAIFKKVEYILSRILLKSVDGYVLFAQQMQDCFARYGKPYTIIEGVYRDKYSMAEVEKKPFIMHAGSLHHNIGIEELIAAFEQISDKKVELWFFGSGAMDEYITKKAQKNSRIKHMGFVDPRVLFEYEKEATLLVNVRDPNADYTKYSFPSKTFEYMASGTPFLTTDLPGIPSEYKDYIFTIKENSIEEVKAGLEKVLSLSDCERYAFGKRAREFVMNNKNKTVQSQKMVNFLDQVN